MSKKTDPDYVKSQPMCLNDHGGCIGNGNHEAQELSNGDLHGETVRRESTQPTEIHGCVEPVFAMNKSYLLTKVGGSFAWPSCELL